MIKSADPLPIWAGQQWQGSVDVDDEEGGKEDVENGTEEGTKGTADSGMSSCLDIRINYFSEPLASASVHRSLRHFSW